MVTFGSKGYNFGFTSMKKSKLVVYVATAVTEVFKPSIQPEFPREGKGCIHWKHKEGVNDDRFFFLK